ncbi:isopeptide-forming domain-containing fimbrial protein [Paraclostridium bifermentans]|uniref:isopeptide-forming domain-containing fimbrial protein n=1 Tax=Paraclostridium bifermentans TaxID=1490 RepID=UPI00359C84BD
MPDNILSISIDNTQNVSIVIGTTSNFNMNIKNLSENQRLYNLGLSITLPDGLSLSDSSIPYTSSTTDIDNNTVYSWVNLKDLAPMEVDFSINVTLKCNNTFINGDLIEFGYNFPILSVSCSVDTMPRGSYDEFNEILTELIEMTYVSSRFDGTINTSKKVLKGAGTSIELSDYTQVYTSTCIFTNNSISTSLVNITILLEDGIRYIGNIQVTGAYASMFLNPIINTVTIDGKAYTQLYYSNIYLIESSYIKLTFSYAIWNQYNNNQGAFIAHGTSLNMSLSMVSADSEYMASSYYSFSFLAMDLIILTSISKSIVDIRESIIYSYIYKVGQYYNIQNITVHYFLPDGITYVSSSVDPTSVVDDATLKVYYMTYNFALSTQNSIFTVNINAIMDDYYRYKLDGNNNPLPAIAFDNFLVTTDISGILIGPLTQVTDSSSVGSSINIGSINKEFIQAYYKDGTPKSISTLAPLDLAEYTLYYNASNLEAIQKQVYIDDFFPLSAGPIDNLNYIYTDKNPINLPELISPHGVDFYYGDVEGGSYFTINFKVAIDSLGSPSQNINLMKLKGVNTYGYAYSDRDQVVVNIGKPNITLSKTVSGPNKNGIKANEVYTYTVTINNTNNLGSETDAFDFTLSDTLSENLFVLNPDSIIVSGTGDYNQTTINNNIDVYINKLSPGQSITLTYDVGIISTIAPGVSITTTATNTNPYSQVYDSESDNFRYTNLNKSASVTISSKNITIQKTNLSNTFKVGSSINYSIIITVPKGTIAYGLYVEDILPNNDQRYIGPAYKNGVLVTPEIVGNKVTFPTEEIIDAIDVNRSIVYTLKAKIDDSANTIGVSTSIQGNTANCYYQVSPEGSFRTRTSRLNVVVNHPSISIDLSVTDKTTYGVYTQIANINNSSILQFKLLFKNNSPISLKNAIIEIPIDDNFIFSSIGNTGLCSANYNSSDRKIIINVPNLNGDTTGYMFFTVFLVPNLLSSTTIDTQATTISYYNDISTTKVYGGEQSNLISCVLQPNLTLTPDPIYKINDTTSFIVTSPGNTAVILDYFRNTGGGHDSFNLIIQEVNVDYTLYIDNVKIADVPANTLYEMDLPEMSNLAPNTSKVIKITATIPVDQPLGIRYDFLVTAKSKSSPYPEKTVLNIDPNPF